MPRFFEQSDLELALGGETELVRLLDRDGDGIADADLVERCQDSGSNEIASYFGVTVDPDALTKPYPMVLITMSADAGAFYAWRYGLTGQAIPPEIVTAHDKAVEWAVAVGKKRATLVRTPKAVLDQPIGVVDHDPNGCKISVKGLSRGFR